MKVREKSIPAYLRLIIGNVKNRCALFTVVVKLEHRDKKIINNNEIE